MFGVHVDALPVERHRRDRAAGRLPSRGQPVRQRPFARAVEPFNDDQFPHGRAHYGDGRHESRCGPSALVRRYGS